MAVVLQKRAAKIDSSTPHTQLIVSVIVVEAVFEEDELSVPVIVML
jgi:hypothetical protein